MKAFLSKYIKFSDNEYKLFISNANLKQYKKHEHLLLANSPVEKIFFVKSGLIRGYRLLDGADISHCFFLDNWFATDYESFLTGKTGGLYAEALVDTTVYEFKKSTLYNFFQSHSNFEKIRTIIAEDAYLQMVNRLKKFQTKNLKERYINLINQNEILFNLVPQKHIASYLGVTPQSLSRIRNSIRND